MGELAKERPSGGGGREELITVRALRVAVAERQKETKEFLRQGPLYVAMSLCEGAIMANRGK